MDQQPIEPAALHALATFLRMEGPHNNMEIPDTTYWAAYEAARVHFGTHGLELSAIHFTDHRFDCDDIAAVADDPVALEELARRMLAAPGPIPRPRAQDSNTCQ